MKPVVEKGGSINGSRVTHPAFGAATLTRVNASFDSSVKLHGSDFKHTRFISMQIHNASISRADSYDHHFPEDRIVEVLFSESQWATFVSSFNQGEGVPCTLNWIKGEGSIPNIEGEDQTKFLKEKVFEHVDNLVEPINSLREILAETKMTKKGEKALSGQIDRLERELKYNIPYFIENIAEHMEGITEKAKV